MNLNKIDLVDAGEVSEIEAGIRAINPFAKLHNSLNCAVPLDAVLARNAFDLDRILELEPEFLYGEDNHEHHDDDHRHDHGGDAHHEPRGLKHYHDEEMQSVSVVIEGEVNPEKFMPWLQDEQTRLHWPQLEQGSD